MIRAEEIAFDVDGVFADTMGLFLEILREDFGIDHIGYEDITEYYLEHCLDIPPKIIDTIINNILEGHFQDRLRPVEGACEVLSYIAVNGPVLFVTARPTVLPIKDWVIGKLPEAAFPVEVIATGALEAKADVLKERRVNFFVEDCLEVCFSLYEQGITPILFCQPWNRSPHPFREVRHWNEIKDMIGPGLR